jgi:hypothetical protein
VALSFVVLRSYWGSFPENLLLGTGIADVQMYNGGEAERRPVADSRSSCQYASVQ